MRVLIKSSQLNLRDLKPRHKYDTMGDADRPSALELRLKDASHAENFQDDTMFTPQASKHRGASFLSESDEDDEDADELLGERTVDIHQRGDETC